MDYDLRWRPEDDFEKRLREISLVRGNGSLVWALKGVLVYRRRDSDQQAWAVQVYSKETLRLIEPTANERKVIENFARAKYGL